MFVEKVTVDMLIPIAALRHSMHGPWGRADVLGYHALPVGSREAGRFDTQGEVTSDPVVLPDYGVLRCFSPAAVLRVGAPR